MYILTTSLQIIVTSKFWRPVLREIYNKQMKDYLIFGSSLDIAFAANTKFDVMFVNDVLLPIFPPNAKSYKLQLICRMFLN